MKSLLLLITSLAVAFVLPSQAQNWTWAETAGGSLPDEANGCFMDAAGNMYMSGFYFSSSINFGNGSSLSNNGIADGFTVKYHANGTTQWASKIKGSNEDKATKCTADGAGNVFTTGYFNSSSIQFGGNNNDNVSNSNGSGFDGFIVKYNSAGTPQWYHAIGNNDDDGGASVAADAQGNVYVTGWWRAASMTVGSTVLTNNGDSDMFLIKYGPTGNVLWVKNAGGLDDDKGRGCAVDPDGNVIVTGYFKGASMTIDGTVYPNSGGKDFFVIKYSPTGTVLAAKTYGGSGGEEAFSCSTDGYGNVFISGNYSSTSVTFDGVVMTNPGSNAGAFLLKLNPSLTAIWARGFSSSDNDEARGCSADSYGNSVVTGVFSGNSLTIGNTTLNNNGGDETFVAKYDPNGNLFWAKKIGKSSDDGSNDCAIIDNGKVIIAGYYNSSSLTLGTIDLDNSYFGIATSDVFIGRMCEATTGTHTVSACSDYTWVDGNTYTSNTNSPIFSFPNSASCDSIVTLNLTLNPVDVSVTNVSSTLIANSSFVSYRWLDCANNYAFILGQTSQVFNATIDGSYAVEVTENTCVDTSECFMLDVITVGMEENIAGSPFHIYPNPTIGECNILLDDLQQDVTLTVRDVFGKTLFVNHYSNFKSTQIQLFSEAGVYIIELRTPTNRFVVRALKL